MSSEEIAIIFKQKMENKQFILEPIECVSGYYDEFGKVFIDDNEYVYSHFAYLLPGRCFGMRQNIEDIKKNFTDLPLEELKIKFLEYFSKGKFIIKRDEDKIKLLFAPKDNEIAYVVESFNIFDIDNFDFVDHDELELSDQEIPIKEKKEDTKKIVVSKKVNFNAKEVRDLIKETVISQDRAVDKIVTTIWRNLKQKNVNGVKNILVSGPTGAGKTEIFRTLSQIIDVPVIEVDANSYTAMGYVGNNVEDMLIKLIVAAEGDLVKASHGIIVIDEFDKLAGSGKNDEIATTKVQDALLKMVEGNNYRVMYKDSIYNINTAGITFIGAGSFARVSKNKVNTVGFNRDTEENAPKLVDEEVIDFGFEPEILGRFPVRVALKKLEIEDLKSIILKSNKSAFNEEVKFLKEIGINTVFDDKVIEQIAKKAYETGNGARGISRIITDVFDDILLEVSNESDVYKEVELKSDITEDNKRYILRK